MERNIVAALIGLVVGIWLGANKQEERDELRYEMLEERMEDLEDAMIARARYEEYKRAPSIGVSLDDLLEEIESEEDQRPGLTPEYV